MRTVDTSALKSLGAEGRGPWMMDGGMVLRTASGNHAIRTEEEARAMLETYRAAASVAGAPQGHEVVAIDGGFGIAVDYVAGIAMVMHIALGSYAPGEAGMEMGVLLRGLHKLRMGAGRDWNAAFREWADDLAPQLSADSGSKLVRLVADIPGDGRLLHGDFHVGNVVVSGGKLALIDMECAGFGHPVYDLAISRSRILENAACEAERLGIDIQQAERAAHAIWRGLLEGYFEGAGASELADLDRRIEVLSAVERFGFACTPGESRHDFVERSAGRLTELLSCIDRLWF